MIIYKITNKINNKVYIGQTKFSLKRRWASHCCDALIRPGNNLFHNAIKKHGRDNFIVEQIDETDNIDDLNILEKKYINEYNSLAPNGYNLKTGGQVDNRYTIESRIRMSTSKTGRRLSDETKAKMSASHKKPEHYTEEVLRRRSDNSKRIWQDPQYRKNISKKRKEFWANPDNIDRASKTMLEKCKDPEYIARVSAGVRRAQATSEYKANLKKAKEKTYKKIIDQNGVIYNSIVEASEKTNTLKSSIVKNLKGKYKTANGYIFKYVIDDKNGDT